MYIARKAGARFGCQQYTERKVDQEMGKEIEKYVEHHRLAFVTVCWTHFHLRARGSLCTGAI